MAEVARRRVEGRAIEARSIEATAARPVTAEQATAVAGNPRIASIEPSAYVRPLTPMPMSTVMSTGRPWPPATR